MIVSLEQREEKSASISPALIGVPVLVAAIFTMIAIYVYIHKRRLRNPKYITTSTGREKPLSWSAKFKAIFRKRKRKTDHSRSHNTNHAFDTSYSATHQIGMMSVSTLRTAPNGSNTDVNRNTSVRSIATLPAYRPHVAQGESLIAQEGERAGIDTVLEYPETAEEEESRREEDMDAIYRMRQLRQIELDLEAERQRQRQDAHNRGDWTRLRELRLEVQRRDERVGTATNTLDSGRVSCNVDPSTAAGEAVDTIFYRERPRRISAVSYAELGLARHDGSRIRNTESTSHTARPFLESAARILGHARVSVPTGHQTHAHTEGRRSRFHFPTLRGRARYEDLRGVASQSDQVVATPQAAHEAADSALLSTTDHTVEGADSSGMNEGHVHDNRAQTPSAPPEYHDGLPPRYATPDFNRYVEEQVANRRAETDI